MEDRMEQARQQWHKHSVHLLQVLQACGGPGEAATGSSETEETKKAEKAVAYKQTIAVGGLEKLVSVFWFTTNC